MGQTKVDLAAQSKRVDFSNATATKPFKAGTSLPTTCEIGEGFYNVSAEPGKNIYVCTSPSTWTLSSGSGELLGGAGILLASSTVRLDEAVAGMYMLGVGAPAVACRPGGDVYLDTVNHRYYACTGTDSWQELARITGGDGIPGTSTCTEQSQVGTLYYRSLAVSEEATLYVCSRTGLVQYGWELVQGVRNLEEQLWLRAGVQGQPSSTVLPSQWSSPASNGATLAANGTAPATWVSYDFDATTVRTVDSIQILPGTWTSSKPVTATIEWTFTGSASGNVVWDLSVGCVATGGSWNAVLNPAVSITAVVTGTANTRLSSAFPALNMTGCTPGSSVVLRLSRNGPATADTSTATAKFIGLRLAYQRSQK